MLNYYCFIDYYIANFLVPFFDSSYISKQLNAI